MNTEERQELLNVRAREWQERQTAPAEPAKKQLPSWQRAWQFVSEAVIFACAGIFFGGIAFIFADELVPWVLGFGFYSTTGALAGWIAGAGAFVVTGIFAGWMAVVLVRRIGRAMIRKLSEYDI